MAERLWGWEIPESQVSGLVTGWTQEEEQVSVGGGDPGSGLDTVRVRYLGDIWGPVGCPGRVLSCLVLSWLLMATPSCQPPIPTRT